MKYFKSKDIEFLMRTIVFSLLALALLHSFAPYFSDSVAGEPTRAEIENLAEKTTLITPDGVSRRLSSAKRPTMLVVYASWCSYCRGMMPVVHALWQEGKIDASQLMLLSVDKEVTTLSKYLLTSHLADMIAAPIMLKSDPDALLSDALRQNYSGFKGSIPYIGIFDADGIMIDEVMGDAPKRQVEQLIQQLK